MNETQATKTVFITAGVLVVAALLEDNYVPQGFNLYKRIWAIGMLALLLSITADFVPEVAGPLALLILTGVAVHDSQYFSKALDTGGSNPKKKAGKK